MSELPSEKISLKSYLSKEGWIIAFAAFILAITGLIMVFSVTGGQILAKHFHSHHGLPSSVPNTNRFLYLQGAYILLGIVTMLIAAWIKPHMYRKLMIPALLFSILLLVGVLFLGVNINGARRWYRISFFSLQPMEISKITLILFLAYILEKRYSIMGDIWKGFFQPFVIVGIMVVLLLKQNDLGSAVLFIIVSSALMFIAGSRIYYFLIAFVVSAPLLWFYVVGGWRLSKRIIPFLYPQYFKQEAAYQIIRSLDAFGSGGMWGFGLGNGPYKSEFLPEAHTDYIGAMIGQEWGFAGTGFLILMYGLILYAGVRIALRNKQNLFRMYVALGITLMLVFQAIINLSVVMNLIPSKGITLPFVSYGGSSILLSFASIGVILSMDRHPNYVTSAVSEKEKGKKIIAIGKKRRIPLSPKTI